MARFKPKGSSTTGAKLARSASEPSQSQNERGGCVEELSHFNKHMGLIKS
jgi:hypothetical protein